MSEKPEKIWLIWVAGNVRWSEKPDQRFPYDLGYIRKDIVQEMLKEQREACARKSKKVIDEYFRTSGHNKMMQGRIENACRNATGESDDMC